MLKRPGQIGRLAQLVERFVYTEDVGGSSPSSPTILSKRPLAYDPHRQLTFLRMGMPNSGLSTATLLMTS